jgi:hypothetical protein
MHRSFHSQRLTRARVAAAMALSALTFVAVLILAGPGMAVTLLTKDPNLHPQDGCFLSFVVGDLITDPTYGTAIIEVTKGIPKDYVHTYPVMWPPGYTGRQAGSEVEVLNRSGRAVARTGSHIKILGGYYSDNPRVWLACNLGPVAP